MIDDAFVMAEVLGWGVELLVAGGEPAAATVASLRGDAPELAAVYDAASAAIEENPNHVLAHFQRGVICQSRGWHDIALSSFAVVLRLDPKHARAWLLSSEVLAALGLHEQAQTARQRALEIDPGVG